MGVFMITPREEIAMLVASLTSFSYFFKKIEIVVLVMAFTLLSYPLLLF